MHFSENFPKSAFAQCVRGDCYLMILLFFIENLEPQDASGPSEVYFFSSRKTEKKKLSYK